MYTNQLCHVRWGGEKSASFRILNGVKQGEVISPLLFSLYVDELFLLLKKSGLGCHVMSTYLLCIQYIAHNYTDNQTLNSKSIWIRK